MAVRCYVVDMCCYMLLFFLMTMSNSCMVDMQNDKRLTGSTFRVTENSRLYSCAAECVSYALCKSFNFERHSRKCYLNTENQGVSILKNDTDFIYSEKEAWKYTPLGPCQSAPCGLAQRCTVKRNTSVSCVDIVVSLAQGKPTTASSAKSSVPENAVDGSSGTYWSSGSCFHVTSEDSDPWWQVDLQDLAVVVKVHILGRSGCCPERLHDFAVEVFTEDPVIHPDAELQLCHMFNDTVTEGGETVQVTCTTPVTGRYLRIHGKNKLYLKDILQFCEVTVFGITLINW